MRPRKPAVGLLWALAFTLADCLSIIEAGEAPPEGQYHRSSRPVLLVIQAIAELPLMRTRTGRGLRQPAVKMFACEGTNRDNGVDSSNLYDRVQADRTERLNMITEFCHERSSRFITSVPYVVHS